MATVILFLKAIPQMIELISNLVAWFGPDFDKAIREQNANYKALKAAMESKDEDAIRNAERAIAHRWNHTS